LGALWLLLRQKPFRKLWFARAILRKKLPHGRKLGFHVASKRLRGSASWRRIRMINLLILLILGFALIMGVASGIVAYREGRFGDWVLDVLLFAWLVELFDA
jgi:hypothetical protein